MTLSARDKSRDESSVPEIDMKTQSQGSSIPEEIPEEYANDTFESVNSTVTPTHSTPVHGNFSFKRDSSPTVSRTSSKDGGSKSEEEASMTGEHFSRDGRVALSGTRSCFFILMFVSWCLSALLCFKLGSSLDSK